MPCPWEQHTQWELLQLVVQFFAMTKPLDMLTTIWPLSMGFVSKKLTVTLVRLYTLRMLKAYLTSLSTPGTVVTPENEYAATTEFVLFSSSSSKMGSVVTWNPGSFRVRFSWYWIDELSDSRSSSSHRLSMLETVGDKNLSPPLGWLIVQEAATAGKDENWSGIRSLSQSVAVVLVNGRVRVIICPIVATPFRMVLTGVYVKLLARANSPKKSLESITMPCETVLIENILSLVVTVDGLTLQSTIMSYSPASIPSGRDIYKF